MRHRKAERRGQRIGRAATRAPKARTIGRANTGQEDMDSQPVRQLWLPLQVEGELGMCDLSEENPTETGGLMERVVAPENLRAAYGRVMRNKGAPGVDGMTVEGLAAHLRAEWPAIRGRLLAGT